MATLELIKGIAQLSPGGRDVVKWVDEEKNRFWKSAEQGGFFDSPWAEVARTASNMAAAIVGGGAVVKGVERAPGALGKALPGLESYKPALAEMAKRLTNSFTGKVAVGGVAGGAPDRARGVASTRGGRGAAASGRATSPRARGAAHTARAALSARHHLPPA
jgi:hypothetical protein